MAYSTASFKYFYFKKSFTRFLLVLCFWFNLMFEILLIHPSDVCTGFEAPFDLYCPSKTSEVKKRQCPKCNLYHPSKAAMLRNKAIHDQAERTQLLTEEESASQALPETALMYRSLLNYLEKFNQFENW